MSTCFSGDVSRVVAGAVLMGAVFLAGSAMAAPDDGDATAAASAAAAAALAATAAPSPVKPQRCMRLPLSDIAFGQDATIKQAEMRLGEYAAKEQKRRGWGSGPLAKSNQTASCDVYLVLPFAGTEYKCLVTATFCQK